MEYSDLSVMYRVQNASYKLNEYLPVKRVIVNGLGKIDFNPDGNKYIYFSKTNKHHVYYIFYKVLKIIRNNVKMANKFPKYADAALPPDFTLEMAFRNSQIIKDVKKFFSDYMPPCEVELVTLRYLNTFAKMVNEYATKNKNKTGGLFLPELSDTKYFGGAYGLNNAWLELLRCSTVSTEVCKVSLNKFFDFLIDNSYRSNVCRQSIDNVLKTNPHLFEFMEAITYSKLPNIGFSDKNNMNNIITALHYILDNDLYNQTHEKMSQSSLNKLTKEFRAELELNRE